MKKSINTMETLDKAMGICTIYLPFMKTNKEKRQAVLFCLMDNLDYCIALVKFHTEHKDNKLVAFKGMISHDLYGLMSKDEHFIPQIG